MKTTQTKRGRPVGSKNKMTTKITVGGKVKIKPGDGSEFPEIDKFKTNPFAKKYKKSLESEENPFLSEELIRHEDRLGEWYETRQDTSPLNKKVMGSSSLESFGYVDDIIESANQVKSWKRDGISETVNLTYLFLAFIIGFSVCAVVVTPIIINSV